MPKDFSKTSKSLGDSMAKLYKIGGLMLVFVFVGTVTMTGGNFFGGEHSGIIVGVGAIVTLACLGLFARTQVQAIKMAQEVTGFCDLVTGSWWERIKPDNASALSFVTIETNPATGTIKMTGEAFDVNGKRAARWESMTSCINLAQRKTFYYWTGAQEGASYEGFGEITFQPPDAGRIDRGNGFFSDTKLNEVSSTTKKEFTLWRCTDAKEMKIMSSFDEQAISELVRAKLK